MLPVLQVVHEMMRGIVDGASPESVKNLLWLMTSLLTRPKKSAWVAKLTTHEA